MTRFSIRAALPHLRPEDANLVDSFFVGDVQQSAATIRDILDAVERARKDGTTWSTQTNEATLVLTADQARIESDALPGLVVSLPLQEFEVAVRAWRDHGSVS